MVSWSAAGLSFRIQFWLTNISTTGVTPNKTASEIYGVELPDQVFEKVYNKNADKIFSQFKGNNQLEGKKP